MERAFVERIRERLEATGKSARAASLEAGLSETALKDLLANPTQWPKLDTMQKLAVPLGADAAWLAFGDSATTTPGRSSASGIESNVVIPPDDEPVDAARFKGPRDVEVLGTGSGGDGEDDFSFNGQVIDYAPRPPGIANRRDVYVIYVRGDSVSPAYEDGSPVYVDPHRRPAPRDYVVVEMKGVAEGEPGKAFVKRLVKRGGGKLVVEQHNPPDPIPPIDESDVVRVHRVIPWPELIGI